MAPKNIANTKVQLSCGHGQNLSEIFRLSPLAELWLDGFFGSSGGEVCLQQRSEGDWLWLEVLERVRSLDYDCRQNWYKDNRRRISD